MGIAEQHFDLVVELVMETLEDHAVGEEHLGSIAKGVRAISLRHCDGKRHRWVRETFRE